MRVAILEDDPDQAALLSEWITAAGHDSHVYHSGRRLLNQARRESFDLFLLDWDDVRSASDPHAVALDFARCLGVYLAGRGLAYDHRHRTGATLHLLGALREHGKMGVTCIGDTPEHAELLYREVVGTLL